MNWNENGSVAESQREPNTNWATPVWSERQPSRNWSQSQNNFKNSRKISAKQHYLSVARYVAGQSTNLSSRYRKYRNIALRILLIYVGLAVAYLIGCFCLGQNAFHELLVCLVDTAVQTVDNVLNVLPIKRLYLIVIRHCKAYANTVLSLLRASFNLVRIIPYVGEDIFSFMDTVLSAADSILSNVQTATRVPFSQTTAESCTVILDYFVNATSTILELVDQILMIVEQLLGYFVDCICTLFLILLGMVACVFETVFQSLLIANNILFQASTHTNRR